MSVVVALLMSQVDMPHRASVEAARQLGAMRRAKVEQLLASKPANLAAFATCSHSKPGLTGIDWYTVNWGCPTGVSMPSNGTAFKFKPGSDEIVKIEATNTPVFSKVQPNG